jgi:hypothetical protein
MNVSDVVMEISAANIMNTIPSIVWRLPLRWACGYWFAF